MSAKNQVSERILELNKNYEHESSNFWRLTSEIEEAEKELHWKIVCKDNLSITLESIAKELSLFKEILGGLTDE